MTEKICAVPGCGAPLRGNSTFCSERCRIITRDKDRRNCEWCKRAKLLKGQKRFCSLDCSHAHRRATQASVSNQSYRENAPVSFLSGMPRAKVLHKLEEYMATGHLQDAPCYQIEIKKGLINAPIDKRHGLHVVKHGEKSVTLWVRQDRCNMIKHVMHILAVEWGIAVEKEIVNE